jgi:hypothetical protein
MPKNIPLKIRPGVYKQGTRYEAKGRWFDADLVRWHNGRMGAIGGWSPMVKSAAPEYIDVDEVVRGMVGWLANNNQSFLAFGTPTKLYEFHQGVVTDITLAADQAVDAAISDDGGVFTDETTDANEATADDVVLIPASPANDDAFYIGDSAVFSRAKINVSTAATDGTITWEYYNGSTWATLTVTDGTSGFQTAGSNEVTWIPPSDWATTTVNSQGPFYYVRARVSAAGTTTALAAQCWASNFVTGNADATITSGNYGDGPYGFGNYGEGDAGITEITEAQSWQLDTFGEDLVAIAYSDGQLLYYDRSAGTQATVIANAPTGCRGVVVTPERFVVTLGASGNLPTGAEGDRREVIFSDQEDVNTWEPTTGNQAGSFVLPGAGKLMCGRRSRSETLLWTDVDMYAMRYVGGILVYSFQQVGSNCGTISRTSTVAVDGKAFWMGHRKFHMYDGFVQEIPCTVSDYVFDDLNRVQASKIFAMTISQFNTVMWFYPSAGSTENDRYVSYNWSTNHWEIGNLDRTAGCDRGAFEYPVMADSGGVVYDHERGTAMLDTDLSTSLVPSAASGPVELGAGDQTMTVVGLIPDENTLGDVSLKIYSALYPTEAETLSAAFTAREPTDVRITARQIRLEVTQVNPGWHFGTPRLIVEASGRR